MYSYFAQFIFLLLIYFFFFLFLWGYFFILCKLGIKIEKNQFILLEKIYNNQIYYAADLKSDAPFILEWLTRFRYKIFFCAYSFTFVLFLYIKFMQFWIVIILLPFYFLYFIICLIIKREITYKCYIKANPSFFDAIILVFLQIPLAFVFNKLYLFFKLIFKRPRGGANFRTLFFNWLKHFFYVFVYKALLGLPLWNLYLINLIAVEIASVGFFSARISSHQVKPLLVRIREILIGSHQKSYIYEAWRSRIYYKDDILYFNPTKIVAETLAGGNKCNSILKTVSTHFINNRGELKKTHHTGIEILEEAGVGKEYKSNWSSCAIVTHKPLEGQSYFSYLRNASQQNNESSYAAQALKNQYIVTNNVSHTNSVQDGPTKNFIPSQHELRQLRDLTLLQRSIAKPGIYLQNGIEKRYMFPK